MRVSIAQINTTVGDLEGNVDRCLAAIRQARRQAADLVVLPEMALPGYPPRDILLDPTFVEAAVAATDDLAWLARGGPPVVVGTVSPSGRYQHKHPGLHNAAVLLDAGKVTRVAAKRLLPVHDVFYEPRWFSPGPPSSPVLVGGLSLGFLVCEDLWDEGCDVHPSTDLIEAGAQALICLSASPYRPKALAERLYHARRQPCPLIYANLVGATDELIFDGRSFALDGSGEILAQLSSFEEDIRVVDLEAEPLAVAPDPGRDEKLFRALVLGVRDFYRKNGLERAYLGLSGGVDSAVVAVIAAHALGPERVTAVAIPSRYNDPRSTTCAQELAQALGISFEVVELEKLHAAAETTLHKLLDKGTTAENIQARLRAMILMAFVNRFGGGLLACSNKTELALGYATLYGDMAGTLGPIADLTKPEVVSLARWINTRWAVIPPFVLERPPSAELRPEQVDPFDYPKIAPAMEELVQANRSDLALRRSEHKRWQMGVVLKVSEKAFGTGRLIPITRR